MRKRDFVTTGIPSIFTIFTVLVLVVLSLMSYGTGRTDLEESKLSFEQTQGYFLACQEGTRLYEEASRALSGLTGEELMDAAKAYFSSLESTTKDLSLTGVFDREGKSAAVEISFSPRQSLQATFLLTGEEDYPLTVSTWKCVQSGQWSPHVLQNLFDPSKGIS